MHKKHREKIKEMRENIARIQKVSRWSSRLEKLQTRKMGAMTLKDFAEKHGLSYFTLIGFKNGIRIPCVENFEQIEAALKIEGV